MSRRTMRRWEWAEGQFEAEVVWRSTEEKCWYYWPSEVAEMAAVKLYVESEGKLNGRTVLVRDELGTTWRHDHLLVERNANELTCISRHGHSPRRKAK